MRAESAERDAQKAGDRADQKEMTIHPPILPCPGTRPTSRAPLSFLIPAAVFATVYPEVTASTRFTVLGPELIPVLT
jgi:hypothetical protein